MEEKNVFKLLESLHAKSCEAKANMKLTEALGDDDEDYTAVWADPSTYEFTVGYNDEFENGEGAAENMWIKLYTEHGAFDDDDLAGRGPFYVYWYLANEPSKPAQWEQFEFEQASVLDNDDADYWDHDLDGSELSEVAAHIPAEVKQEFVDLYNNGTGTSAIAETSPAKASKPTYDGFEVNLDARDGYSIKSAATGRTYELFKSSTLGGSTTAGLVFIMYYNEESEEYTYVGYVTADSVEEAIEYAARLLKQKNL